MGIGLVAARIARIARAARGAGLAGALAVLGGACGPDLIYDTRPLAQESLETRLVVVKASGLVPSGTVRLSGDQVGLAFLNDTEDRAISVIFPGRQFAHLRCPFTRGFDADAVGTYTVAPLAPGEIACLCGHEPGAFDFEVHGAGDKPLRGKVEIAAGAPKEEP